MALLVKIIHQLKEQGISIIYISHKLDEIFDFCDIVSVMRDGKVIDTKPKSEFTRNELITKMVGRTIENEYPERPRNPGENLMEVRASTRQTPRHLSSHLEKGEILGLVGLVGRGPDRDSPGPLRRRQGQGAPVTIRGKAVTIREPQGRQGRGPGAHTRGPQAPGPGPAVLRGAQHLHGVIGRFTRFGFIRRSLEKGIGARQVQVAQDQDPEHQSRHQEPLGRQPAEVHSRTLARNRSPASSSWTSRPRGSTSAPSMKSTS